MLGIKHTKNCGIFVLSSRDIDIDLNFMLLLWNPKDKSKWHGHEISEVYGIENEERCL